MARRVVAPPGVLAVVGAFLIAGATLMLPAIRGLPDAVRFLLTGEISRAFVSMIMGFYLVLIGLGLLCVACARLLYKGDPLGRVLSVVVAGALATGIVLSDAVVEGWVLITLLATVAVILVTVTAPAVRMFFAEPATAREPTPVTAARAIVAVVAGVYSVLGIGFLPFIGLDNSVFLAGAAFVGVSVLALVLVAQVGRGSQQARNALTGLMAANAALSVWLESDDPALFVPLALSLAVIGLLWLPAASKAHFNGTFSSEPLTLRGGATVIRDSVASALGALTGRPASYPPMSKWATTSTTPTPRMGYADPPPRLGTAIRVVPVRPGIDAGWCEALGFGYKPGSWVPEVGTSERHTLVAAVFIPTRFEIRGSSSLLVDGRRMVGICYEGKSSKGDFGPDEGRMVAWELALDGIGRVDVKEFRPGSLCAIVRSASDGSEIMRIARLRRWVEGAAPEAISVELLARRLHPGQAILADRASEAGTMAHHGPGPGWGTDLGPAERRQPQSVRPPHASGDRPSVGGWGWAILLLGLLGAAIGYFATRSQDPRRANHIMKWGLIMTIPLSVLLWALLFVSVSTSLSL